MFGPVEQSKTFPLFFKMPTGPGHYFGRPAAGRLYGQKFLVAFLMELSKQWAGGNPLHPFGIGDLAAEDGSDLADHVSHSTGAAVDLFIIHKNGVRRNDKANVITFKDKNAYDAARTTGLAKLIAAKALQYKLSQFLYNDPDVQTAVQSSPPIQTLLGHDEHIHLLFNGQHPHSEEELDRILGIKNLSDRLQEFLQELVSSAKLLMFGSREPEVRALQVLLTRLGSAQSPPLAEDSIFGSKTRARVQEFQQQHALAADGIVGPKTNESLRLALPTAVGTTRNP